MPLKKEDVESKLRDKFHFCKIETTGRNPHNRWAFFYDGKKIATTGFSRGARGNDDLDDSLLKIMAKEVRVQTLQNFKGMITCSVSPDGYVKILKEQGFIPR